MFDALCTQTVRGFGRKTIIVCKICAQSVWKHRFVTTEWHWIGRRAHGRSVISFLLNIPSIYTSQHTIQCVLFTCPSPFFPPFSPSPTATLPTFFPLCLIMDFVMFKDGFSGVYWLLLMAEEQGEGRKKGLETCRAQSIILIKERQSCSGVCDTHVRVRNFLCPLISQVSDVRSHASQHMKKHTPQFWFCE